MKNFLSCDRRTIGGLRNEPMSEQTVLYYQSREELANALTHGFATLASVAGLILLIVFSVKFSGDAVLITSVSIFGASMILLYLASTLYHAITHPRAKRVLQLLDHAMIFVLIAGSYTPFCLVTLEGLVGYILCAAVWSIAVIGVTMQSFLLKKSDWISCALYLTMGWLVVFVIKPLIASLATGGLILLAAGGVAYSLGVIFFLCERIPYNHAIWHVFVFAGTVLQFLAVLLYVIPVL